MICPPTAPEPAMMKFPKPDMRFVNEKDRLSEHRREPFIQLDFLLQSVIGHQASA